MSKYLVEFLGTAGLILVVGLSQNPIAIGLGLVALVYWGGHISGAHYNWAVTVAVFLRGKLDKSDLIKYLFAQVGGAFFGALLIYYFRGNAMNPAPSATVSLVKAGAIEILFTFFLASVILAVATSKKLEGNSFYGLAIGLTLLLCAASGGSLSGGVYNPSIALGAAIVSGMTSVVVVENLMMYLVSTIAGGALAAVVFRIINADEF